MISQETMILMQKGSPLSAALNSLFRNRSLELQKGLTNTLDVRASVVSRSDKHGDSKSRLDPMTWATGERTPCSFETF